MSITSLMSVSSALSDTAFHTISELLSLSNKGGFSETRRFTTSRQFSVSRKLTLSDKGRRTSGFGESDIFVGSSFECEGTMFKETEDLSISTIYSESEIRLRTKSFESTRRLTKSAERTVSVFLLNTKRWYLGSHYFRETNEANLEASSELSITSAMTVFSIPATFEAALVASREKRTLTGHILSIVLLVIVGSGFWIHSMRLEAILSKTESIYNEMRLWSDLGSD
jgi:hypothetical protein